MRNKVLFEFMVRTDGGICMYITASARTMDENINIIYGTDASAVFCICRVPKKDMMFSSIAQ